MNKQDSVKIVEAFWAAVWQGKDFDAIDRFCVEDFVITSGGVDVVSRESFKAWAKQFNRLVGDLQFDVIETFQSEDGSRVASRWRESGRNNGMFGLPAADSRGRQAHAQLGRARRLGGVQRAGQGAGVT
ncbi:ester cyclase [Polaromonas sp. YR568]|uniref:ester cyclase n=1 Tax=Polaromonas sp. YR568 TaxID=1855301 RepID=UPI00398BED90